MVLTSVVTWLICRLLFRMKLVKMISAVEQARNIADYGKSIIRKQTVLLNSYERELGVASPEEAKRKFDALEAAAGVAKVSE